MRQIETFTVGGVLSTTFRVFGRNLVPFVLLGLIILVPATLANQWAQGYFGAESIPSLLLSTLLSLFSITLVQASMTCAVFHTLRADQQSLIESLAQGARVLPLTILAGIVSSFAITFGILLLIIPGIIFMLMFCVAIPVAAIERKYPVEALKRSAELTKGYKGRLLGLHLLLLVGAAVVVMIVMGVAIGLGISPETALQEDTFSITQPDVWINWIFATVYAVLVSVVYYDLRLMKEDMDSEAAAEVFE